MDFSVVGPAPMSRPFVKRHEHFHPATAGCPEGFLQRLIGLVGVPQREPMTFRGVQPETHGGERGSVFQLHEGGDVVAASTEIERESPAKLTGVRRLR